MRRALVEHDLERVGDALLNKRTRFSRLDGEMVQLELLGLAKQAGVYWQARNPLLARALADWTATNNDNRSREELQRGQADLRRDHERRLRVLERQAAQQGAHTPPHIVTEIEDIRAKIAEIDRQLG